MSIKPHALLIILSKAIGKQLGYSLRPSQLQEVQAIIVNKIICSLTQRKELSNIASPALLGATNIFTDSYINY